MQLHLQQWLACEGLKPFAAIYSTFLQRAYDQVVHDVLSKNYLFVLQLIAGLVGADGPTHAGSFDIATCQIYLTSSQWQPLMKRS